MNNPKVCYVSDLDDAARGWINHLLIDFGARDAVEGISGGICHAANVRGNNDGQACGQVLYIPIEPTSPKCGYDGDIVNRPDYADPDALADWCNSQEAADLYMAAKAAWEAIPGHILCEWPGGIDSNAYAAPEYHALADSFGNGKRTYENVPIFNLLIAYWRACDAIAAAVARVESLPDFACAMSVREWCFVPGIVNSLADFCEHWSLDGTEATRRAAVTEIVEGASWEYVVLSEEEAYRLLEEAETETLKFWEITAYVPDREKRWFLQWWREFFPFGQVRGPLPAGAEKDVWVENWDKWVSRRDHVRYHG